MCPAPCESACVLGINSPAVTIKNIECAIIDHAFENGWIKPQPPAIRTGMKVAVVGSGPSGLACAQQLNKAGHWVTVFERNDAIGGLLQYGIPTMKLSRQVVQRRIRLLEEEGIRFQTNVNVGKDISARDLYEENDALVLCLGATSPRDLPLPGRELEGIFQAMAFLETWQKKQNSPCKSGTQNGPQPFFTAKDKDVIILGGGKIIFKILFYARIKLLTFNYFTQVTRAVIVSPPVCVKARNQSLRSRSFRSLQTPGVGIIRGRSLAACSNSTTATRR